ncbi:DUF6119 family protein [Streptococcus ferus]|uniref:DUF6119 family protein n=1 Tax=Streptococcus ferus TaxID=1345 RepID=UPI0035A018E1
MKKYIKYNVVLHNVSDFNQCLKSDYVSLDYKMVDESKIIGITEGRIYIANSMESPVEWIDELNMYTKTYLDKMIYINKSNKAVMMLKYRNKIFSFIYGYGRTMLKSSTIVKNFGLRTAINLISDENIKSLSTLNISDDYVDVQRQALNFVSQNSMPINTNSEILKSISGRASKQSQFSSISGSDNILFSASSESSIQAVLDDLIGAYESKSYKEKGFEWIDYIQAVKENNIIFELDKKLIETIGNSELDKISICLNRIIEHGIIGGYFIKGMRQELIFENFYDEIPTKGFVDYIIQTNDKKIAKLKASLLYFWNIETGRPEKIANIYDCILFETDYEGERYFINNGDWFRIESDYFNRILEKIELIPKSSIVAPPYKPTSGERKYDEGIYNEEFAEQGEDVYSLFDKHNFRGTQWGRSKVEPADIISRNGQFVHVKKGGSSSTLSHLFAQGLVSSQLLKNEQEFRDFIDNEVSQKFGLNFTDSIEPEVIFGIIDRRYDRPYRDFLPVFSMINLCQVYDAITNLGYGCSILPIEQEIPEMDFLNKKEKQILSWVEENLIDELTVKQILEQMPNDYDIKESTLRKYLKKFEEEIRKIESRRDGKSKKYKLLSNKS